MTKGQRIALQADWWPAACRAQGWKAKDRDLRIRVCAWAVSLNNPSQLELLEAINSDRTPTRYLESTSDLDNKSDIDRVKACLGMLSDNVKQTDEVGRPLIGRARRLRDVIRDQIKCLALFQERPRAYVAEIISDKFNKAQTYSPPLSIRDLTEEPVQRGLKTIPSQLDQLVMTLGRIVNQKRNENVLVTAYKHLQGTEPLTIHEMKFTVKAYCDCAICAKLKTRSMFPPLEENWADFEPETDLIHDGGNPF